MSICAHTQELGVSETCITRGRQWRTELGRQCFLAMKDGEDSVPGPSQCTYLAESSAETSAERSRRLATLTKNKAKRSVRRRSQEREKRTTKSSKVGMPDIQNFFHEALAVIIAQLYTRRKLSVSSIERYHFPVERSMCA